MEAGEGVGGELLGRSHVAFDFHFSLHESSLGVEGAVEDGHSIGIHHGECGIGLPVFALGEGPVSVLEVDGPGGGGFALGGSDVEVIDVAYLLDDLGTIAGEERGDLVEHCFNFHGHLIS